MTPPVITRIAAWSGPRNISTALMRAFGNRTDTFVSDEPFYAPYLLQTGYDHPGRGEILRHHETDWRQVVRWLTGAVPQGKPLWYQKLMTHHMLPQIARDWFLGPEFGHLFLIRDPREMLLSLAKVLPQVSLEQTGLPQQVAIFDLVLRHREEPPLVVDARDVLQRPSDTLEAICGALRIPFEPMMLAWPPGRRPTDGVWAPHWYGQVEQSTSFARYQPKDEPLPDRLRPLLTACQPLYDQLAEHRLARPSR